MTLTYSARRSRAQRLPAGARWRRTFLPCLSVTCLVVAGLYATGLHALPAPWLAALVVFVAASVPPTADALRSAPPRTAGPVSVPRGAPRSGSLAAPPASVPAVSTAAQPAAPRAAVEPARYARADSAETQCPHCGGFAVTSSRQHVCRTCRYRWPVDPARPPLVVVRSWLHREER